MKITIDIDCSPQEARAFLGLPDVEPLQSALMEKVQSEMMDKLAAMDPEAMMQKWMPGGMEGLESLQKAFWSQMTGASGKKD